MTGFLFPGQGAQQVGMGADLVREFPAARKVYERAEDHLKIPLRKLSFEGPAAELTRTRNAQPAIFTHSAAALAVLSGAGHRPERVAGHSLGELTALYAAGVFDFESALTLVGERGRLMERAGRTTPGVMVAVLGLDAGEVQEACHQAAACGPVVLANDNAPKVAVLSGSREAVDRAVKWCRQTGRIRSIQLSVGGAFHSPLMEPARDDWTAVVRQVPMRDPAVLVYGNIRAERLLTAADVQAELIDQLTSPIRWREISARIVEADPAFLVEVGPGDTLRGLILRWLRHNAQPDTLSRWTNSIHLTGTAAQLKAALQALGSRARTRG